MAIQLAKLFPPMGQYAPVYNTMVAWACSHVALGPIIIINLGQTNHRDYLWGDRSVRALCRGSSPRPPTLYSKGSLLAVAILAQDWD